MQAINVAGANLMLGVASGATTVPGGPCGQLPVRAYGDPETQEVAYMDSVWRPTWTELVHMLGGGELVLRVFGDEHSHPPVTLYVKPKA